MSDWGKGVNNNIGWGQGADNNIGWGSIYDKSNAGETLLSGGGFEGMLNLFPNASLGLSLDKLDKNYTGSAIKVRRSSDNDELDIGFVNNELDTASLLSFVNTDYLLIDEDFSNDAGWALPTGTTITGGSLVIDESGSQNIYKSFESIPFQQITVIYTIENYVSGSIQYINFGDVTVGSPSSANGTYTQELTLNDGNQNHGFSVPPSGFKGDITNFEVIQKTANGFVPIIYDQVGSNNMTQTTANLQGQIVSNGEVILIGGKPCIIRSANSNGGYISTFAPNDGVAVKSMFYVGRNINVGRRTGMLGSNTGGQDYVLLVEGGSTATIFDSNVVITENKLNGVSTTFTNRDDAATKLEEQFLLYREIEFSFDDNVLGLGFRKINPSTFGMFTFQELVIFENTDDAVAKENNINERYNIY